MAITRRCQAKRDGKAYWDDGNNYAVATDGAGANKYIGKAIAAAADNDDSARIRMGQA